MALVAPVFASLLIGMVDISRAYSAKLQLEQAAQRSIEKVQQYQATTSTYATLQGRASPRRRPASRARLPRYLDFWLECNGTRRRTTNGLRGRRDLRLAG